MNGSVCIQVLMNERYGTRERIEGDEYSDICGNDSETEKLSSSKGRDDVLILDSNSSIGDVYDLGTVIEVVSET